MRPCGNTKRAQWVLPYQGRCQVTKSRSQCFLFLAHPCISAGSAFFFLTSRSPRPLSQGRPAPTSSNDVEEEPPVTQWCADGIGSLFQLGWICVGRRGLAPDDARPIQAEPQSPTGSGERECNLVEHARGCLVGEQASAAAPARHLARVSGLSHHTVCTESISPPPTRFRWADYCFQVPPAPIASCSVRRMGALRRLRLSWNKAAGSRTLHPSVHAMAPLHPLRVSWCHLKCSLFHSFYSLRAISQPARSATARESLSIVRSP